MCTICSGLTIAHNNMLDSAKMKTKYLPILGVILILILGGGYMLNSKMQTQTVQVQNLQYSPSPAVSQVFRYQCDGGKTAFDALDEKAEVEFSESSFGKLVTSIDGKSQGDGKYWLYSVNDKEATVGASVYICNEGEEIKWELK